MNEQSSRREELIIKIMRAADAGLISLPDRDRRIDNVRRSGSDVELQFIGAELDRLFAAPGPADSSATVSSPPPPPVLHDSFNSLWRNRFAILAPVLLLIVAVMSLAVTMIYLAMRAVMDVGGACATGGPYVSAQQCPDGSWMIAVAVPVLILGAIVGTSIAAMVRAPNLILPMWAGLFGSLGWNFFVYAFAGDDVVAAWLVCGVLLWLMAAPAVLAIIASGFVRRFMPKLPMSLPIWWLGYLVAGGAGVWLGTWSWIRIA